VEKTMPERKCIDPKIVEASSGVAVCSNRYNKYLENDCDACPRLSNNGISAVTNLKSDKEKFDAEIHRDRKAHLAKVTARKTGFYLKQ